MNYKFFWLYITLQIFTSVGFAADPRYFIGQGVKNGSGILKAPTTTGSDGNSVIKVRVWYRIVPWLL